jgi:putative PEP-CTERM system TPR-repeat lipoprotein
MNAVRSILALLMVSVLVTGCDMFVSTETRLERAQKQLDQGNYRAAMSDVKTALESEPENAKARLLLAEVSLQIGDRESADKELERALAAGATPEQASAVRYELLLSEGRADDLAALLEKDTFSPPARRALLTAKLQSAAGKADEAEQTLKSALEQAPGDADIQLDLAKLAAARGDTQPAMALPERIAESGAAHSRALLLRASIKMSQGQFSEAREDLVQAQSAGARNVLRVPEKLSLATYLTEVNLALQDIEGATKSLALLDQWAGQAATTRYLHARIALLNNDPAAAITECQKALRADPNHLQAQLLLAGAHLGQGSLEQAEEALTRLLATQDNIAARKLLAQVYLGRGQPERAQDTLRGASDGAEADPQIDWLMGAALLQSGGSSQDALEHLERSVAGLPDSAERRIELAAAYISARMPAKAVETLNAIPANSPVAARAKTLLVLATATGKSSAEARREIDGLVAKNPNDAALLAAAGSYYAAGSDVEKARGLLSRSVELEPKAVSARLSLTRLLLKVNDVPAAEAQLKEVLLIEPSNQTARIALSELAWSRGDKDQSRKWLEEAISVEPAAVEARLRLAQIAFVDGNANRGRDLVNQATMVGRDRKTALNGAAKVLARAGLTDEALVKFQEAAAAGLGEAELNAARLQMDLNKPDQARKTLQSALTRRPGWREAEQLLIRVEARSGRVERAIALARAQSGASASAVKETEGDIYALANKPAQAVSAYEEAQRQTPSGGLAIKLFNVRRAAGVAAPEASLSQWLQQAPNDVQVRRALVLVYQANGKREEAISQYERLMEQGAGDPVMLNNFAWLLHEKGDARAVELAQRAYAAAPGIAEVADTYGWILVEKDKTAEGMKVLQEALAKAPKNPDVQYHLAAAYAKTGERTKASELVRESLKAKGAFASRAAAEGLLRSLSASTAGSP